jgi:hypothetical protein
VTARADFLDILGRNRRRMDAERRDLAQRVSAAIKASAASSDAPFDLVAYSRVRIALEPILDEFYGTSPNVVGGRFGRLILDQCRAARALAFQRSVQDVRKRLKRHPALLTAIRDEAK